MRTSGVAATKREDMASVLLKCPLFLEFSASELETLLPVLRPETRRVPKDEFAVHIGDRAERLAFILSGKLSERRSDNGRTIHFLCHHGPGTLLGLEAMFSGQRRSHVEHVADENSVLMFFSIRELLTDETCHDRLKDAALLLLSNNSVKRTLQMDVLAVSGLREKIMTFFRAMRDKYDSDTIQLKMTQGGLAEYLGVNRSALSRELNNMQREGILEILPDRRYHIMLWNCMPPVKRHKENTKTKNE